MLIILGRRTDVMISTVMGQRSRSHSNGYGNLVNSIDTERLKGFEEKVSHLLAIDELSV